ncbi:hypothetical protein COCON_G00067790 [Conger conger]|uniref:Ropporin-1-like protein n=1 Tax=Conger conger TaxID=82655 RepID=A0A9Q1DSN1_CONCO|nr:hypothetical protein COCON_G00067790 [Conger conger]
MPLTDTMFCVQQINIPPELPDILKQFTKAAIRTQPHDVLQWSAAYFIALSKGETLPVKERLEMPVATQKTDTGLTPGLLKTLHKQLAPKETVTKEELLEKWKGLCLPKEQLESILALGSFSGTVDWMMFFALGCSALGGTILSAMKQACEILTQDPEGACRRMWNAREIWCSPQTLLVPNVLKFLSEALGSWEHEEKSTCDLRLTKETLACCSNNAAIVKMMIQQGVSEDEVRETDKNSRTGLIVACYQGYVDVVIALAECPYIDVNWQDNEGNTALITAAQAGHIMISNYLLNYYSGLDIERRNCHGFTALMKAAMQGRTDCVRALMLAGADLEARDDGRRLTPRQWALFTSRYETAHLMLRLMIQPSPEQYCDSYQPEWAKLPEMLARAQEPKTCLQKLSETVRGVFSFIGGLEPAEGGVMDHFVRASTGLTSPFVTTACRTVCPGSPPCVGKRRYAVQEILHKQQSGQRESLDPEPKGHHRKLFQNCRAALAHRKKERRSSREVAEGGGSGTQRRGSLLPSRRSSVRPDLPVPKVRVTRAPPPTYEPEKTRKKSSCRDGHLLQIPKWRYKELKEERKKAEEEERKRMEEVERKRVEAIARRRLSAGKRK